MQLRDVDLRSVGHSSQKLWPKTFSEKMPCILHYNAKKIRGTISRQVSDRAQLPDVLKFIVDKESNTYKSGGVTSCILCHPHAQYLSCFIDCNHFSCFSCLSFFWFFWFFWFFLFFLVFFGFFWFFWFFRFFDFFLVFGFCRFFRFLCFLFVLFF